MSPGAKLILDLLITDSDLKVTIDKYNELTELLILNQGILTKQSSQTQLHLFIENIQILMEMLSPKSKGDCKAQLEADCSFLLNSYASLLDDKQKDYLEKIKTSLESNLTQHPSHGIFSADTPVNLSKLGQLAIATAEQQPNDDSQDNGGNGFWQTVCFCCCKKR